MNKQISKPTYVKDNWVNEKTWDFLSDLSFDGYILAGNSVANMYEQIPLQGDLDFWAKDYNKFVQALHSMIKYYSNFKLFPSMIEMSNELVNPLEDLPTINLIFTQLSPNQTIDRFDFPYCKCWWTPSDGLNIEPSAEEAIKTKNIMFTTPNDPKSITYKRILKAVKYGYKFTNKFWSELNHLIINPDAKVNYCGDNSINKIQIHKVDLEDLDMKQFELIDTSIEVTNKNKINDTLTELYLQYEKIAMTPNAKLPVLLKFNSDEIQLLFRYSKLIISVNPLSEVHYLEIRIGDFHVNRERYRDSYYKNNSDVKLNTLEDLENSEDLEDLEDSEDLEDDTESHKKICKKNLAIVKMTNSEPVTRTYLLDDKIPKVIQLNESGSAYILIDYLPEDLSYNAYNQFHLMWNYHPTSKHKIIMYDKEVQVNRYSKSYLNTWNELSHTKSRSYMYSGFNTSENNELLPEYFIDYYTWIQKQDSRYNQVIANWYEDKYDYIASHSDCVRGMILNHKIAIMSFYENLEPNNFRYLELQPKNKTDSLVEKFKIRLSHGSIVTMCGDTQQLFSHGIPQSENDVCSRISLSFRQMKDE